tara:strand:- start:428 stop:559 length:132 start_codon:yes stop_codon:yes gene_type:complete
LVVVLVVVLIVGVIIVDLEVVEQEDISINQDIPYLLIHHILLV